MIPCTLAQRSLTLSLDVELDKRIGKAANMFSRLTKGLWLNKKLTTHTKIQVYRACVLSTLLVKVPKTIYQKQ